MGQNDRYLIVLAFLGMSALIANHRKLPEACFQQPQSERDPPTPTLQSPQNKASKDDATSKYDDRAYSRFGEEDIVHPICTDPQGRQ